MSHFLPASFFDAVGIEGFIMAGTTGIVYANFLYAIFIYIADREQVAGMTAKGGSGESGKAGIGKKV